LGSRVLDASAFYAGIPFGSNEPNFITSLVYDEIQHIKKSHDVVQILIETKRLTIKDPDTVFLNKVKNAATESGDLINLTNEDISSISLSLQLHAELVTDDFAMSNVAKNLGITINPIMTNGIKTTGTWRYYCPACEINFSKTSQCPNCGTSLKRKLIKKN
tara:strand:- start:451 stop:933 length:483 start_codon:yes stop_codon:yes gene_type:complete